MILLALDTATEACSAALAIDGDIRERFEIAPQRHGELILPMVDALLAEAGITLAQIDALAFGRGPGAFTGVRIAVSVAQGIAFGADLPVVPVSSLAALAQGCGRERVLVAVDARLDEVYWGMYTRTAAGLMALQGEERVVPPGQVPVPQSGGWFGAGSGWTTYETELVRRCGDHIVGHDGARLPHAREVARLGLAAYQAGAAVSAEQALPVYLRDDVVWKKQGE
jgi:tRNA threonylcarbamoyladenosine biosynthesis protein TsaB